MPGRPGHGGESLARYTNWPGRRQGGLRLVAVLDKCQAALNQAKPVRSIDFSKEELAVLKPLCLITAKPAMFVGNVAEDGFENNPSSTACALRRRQNGPVVAICAKTGRAGRHGRRGRTRLFLAEMGQDEPGLNRLIRAGLQAARLADPFHRRREGSARLDHPIGATGPQAA